MVMALSNSVLLRRNYNLTKERNEWRKRAEKYYHALKELGVDADRLTRDAHKKVNAFIISQYSGGKDK